LSRSRPCTVLIAAPELLPTLKKRPVDPAAELLAFADADALKALDVISKRRPSVIVLEQDFAATARGAALVRRIQADPALSGSEIRLVSKDSGESSIVEALTAVDEPLMTEAEARAQLDQRGTRRAARFKIGGTVEVVVDGNIATLVDLSTIGAQVLSAIVLRPTQRLRVTLADDHSTIRFNATVAWASFEIPKQTPPRYRAGLEFIDAEAGAVDAFRRRHG